MIGISQPFDDVTWYGVIGVLLCWWLVSFALIWFTLVLLDLISEDAA